jgi:cobalt/nickel transport system permease protein
MHFSAAALHIPDGFLSLAVSLICWVLIAVILRVAIARTSKSLGDRQVPLMGIMAAFLFAAQMINFPVAGGTSGHLVGGALAAIVLGPWPAMIVMTAVIAVQALLFQDGGLLVMGANILNMGVLSAAIGFGLHHGVRRARQLRLLAAGVAAWLAVLAGALAASLELWLSGTVQLQIVIPAMLTLHGLIGLGEALITVAALAFILRTRPDLLDHDSSAAKGGYGWVIAGGLLSLFVLGLAPLASANPDGLNRVALDLGFIHNARPAGGPLAGYSLRLGLWSPAAKTIAGALGAVVAAALALLGARWIRLRA